MTAIVAETLDLSRLPPPQLLPVDFEADRLARMARLVGLFEEAGFVFDVARLDANPGAILQRLDNYRETLVKAGVNDAVLSVLIAFAIGPSLDHLAAFYGLRRHVVVQASGSSPAEMETDADFRRRILFAVESFAAAGPAGAYISHALDADARVLNADVWSPAPGEVAVAVQAREGDGLAGSALVSVVRAYLSRPDIKPLTDVLTVRSVTNHGFIASIDAYVFPGPDPITIRMAIEQSVLAACRMRRTPSREMPRSALIAAAHLPAVDKVILLSPAIDIAMGRGEVPVLTSLDVRVHTYA